MQRTSNKSLPVPIGLLVLLAGLAAGIFAVRENLFLGLRASANDEPSQVRITNIKDTSFTVSWLTKSEAGGHLSFGLNKNIGQIKPDLRDQGSQAGKYLTHYIVVDSLSPQTKYYFKVVSGGKSYGNGSQPYEITTATAKTPPDSDVAQGKILASSGQPAVGAIIYLSLANTTVQSALTDSSGDWIIPLSIARSLDLTAFSAYDREAQIAEIYATNGSEKANATLSTGNDNPTPVLTLSQTGQNYNFLNQVPQTSPTPSPIIQNFNPDQEQDRLSQEEKLSITFPTEGEKINSATPEFFGTGPKSINLDIQIESEVVKAQTVIDNKGQWQWSNKTALSPGEHTVTVSYTDNTGFLKKISRKFTVLAVGQSDVPSFTATPSGELVTPSPTILPSPTLTQMPTPPIRTTLPSTESAVPQSGVNWPTKIFLGAGAATIILGVIFIIF